MPTNSWGQPVGPTVSDWSPRPAPGPVELIGSAVRLVPLDAAAHAGPLFTAFDIPGDEPAWTYMGYGPFGSRAEFDAWARWAASSDAPQFFTWLVNDRAMGFSSLMRADPTHGAIEMGHIALAPALRRTRAATEGLFLMMAHSLDTLGYRRLEWKCDALNAPSRRAALRLGFAYEGTFAAHLIIKGRRRDTAWFAISPERWPTVREALHRWLAPANFDATGAQKSPLAEIRRDIA